MRLGPRLFHNMRASCATDWAEALPAHVVALRESSWLGHSPLVAAKHYLQTLMRLADAHFEVAIRGGAGQSSAARSVPADR